LLSKGSQLSVKYEYRPWQKRRYREVETLPEREAPAERVVVADD